ncbi:response regulator receiver domain protein [Halobacteriovorax sp. BALOs_7]|uniref:response regulator n=1 Tax=unclassified Halobacteriovorax TaxID=2639665 RepID=UPI000EA33986|nr:response regulator [Halobacteriovorax sp. BALOs_7]AYF45101.1 response regulator receiver domain protein [Halobacteriovorax sp. BALOs_7]
MYKILIIDDDEISTHILSTKLKKLQYTVSVYNDPSIVMEDIKIVEDADIVLLDIMMPKFSGYDVLKEIRQYYSQNNIPVIMVTSQNTTSEIVDALTLGANDYVNKPIQFEVLLSRIETQTKVLELHKKDIHNKQIQLFHAIVATYNHEINNQLNIALNISKTLRKDLKDNKAINRLDHAIEKIGQFVNKIEELNPTIDHSMKDYLNEAKMLNLNNEE